MPQPRKGQPTGPARFLRFPQQFGHADPGVFRAASRNEEHELEAAKIQHRFAREVRNQLDRLDLDGRTIAEQVGVSPDHLYRVLRGDTGLRTPLMLRIASAVALTVTVDFAANE